MAERLARLRDKEAGRRGVFRARVERAVPPALLAALGLTGEPPWCQVSLPAPEPGLLRVTPEDLRRLPLAGEARAWLRTLFRVVLGFCGIKLHLQPGRGRPGAGCRSWGCCRPPSAAGRKKHAERYWRKWRGDGFSLHDAVATGAHGLPGACGSLAYPTRAHARAPQGALLRERTGAAVQPAQLGPSPAQGTGPRAGAPVQTRAAAAAAREGAGGGAGDAAGGAPDSPDSAGAGPGDGDGADAAATPAQSLQLENARLRSELAEQVR